MKEKDIAIQNFAHKYVEGVYEPLCEGDIIDAVVAGANEMLRLLEEKDGIQGISQGGNGD